MKKIMIFIVVTFAVLIGLAWTPYSGYIFDGENGDVTITNMASIEGTIITDGTASLSGGTLTGTSAGTFSNYIKTRTAYIEFMNLGTVSGTADSIHLDYAVNFDSLITGMTVYFIADSAVTGASTLTIDGLAEKAIFENHDVSATDANDIKAGMIVSCMYDGTQWIQFSQGGN